MNARALVRQLANGLFLVSGKVPGAQNALLKAARRYATSRTLTPRDVRFLFSCAQRLARGRGEWIVTTPGGLRFDVHDQSQSVNAILLFRGTAFEHAWEPQTSRLLLALTRPADHVVFAGANVGYDAVLIGNQLRGLAGRCYAFEPVLDTFEALKKNISLNDLASVIVPFQMALGRSDGTGRISIAGESSSFLFHRDNKTLPREEVPVRSLDSVMRDGDVPLVSALIMDVEGFEVEVLHGANALLESGTLRFVMAEINRATDVSAPGSNEAVVARLLSAGFDLYAVIDDYQGRQLPSRGPCELKRICSAGEAFASGGRWLNVLAIGGDELTAVASHIRIVQ